VISITCMVKTSHLTFLSVGFRVHTAATEQGGGLAQPQLKRHVLDSITSARTWHLQSLINCTIWHRSLLAFLTIALITAKRALCSGDFISDALSKLAVASISSRTDSRWARLEWSLSLLPTLIYIDPFEGLDVNSCRPGVHLRSLGAMGELQRSQAGSILVQALPRITSFVSHSSLCPL
jgi:hypothetical protein